MPDLYLTIADQPDAVLDAIASSMDARGDDPQMAAFCADYMGRVGRQGGTVVEIGCGNGASTLEVLRHLAPDTYVGIDPAAGLLDKAKARFAEVTGASFRTGTASDTGLADESCDVVVAHTIYSHLPDPEAALAEAMRILRPGGTLALFDGDYATNTVALMEGDPLQSAMGAAQRHLIHAPYIMRNITGMALDAGFSDTDLRAHGFVQTDPAEYIIGLMERGSDAAARAGEMTPALAKCLITEARQRAKDGRFYGAILFVSLLARKPG